MRLVARSPRSCGQDVTRRAVIGFGDPCQERVPDDARDAKFVEEKVERFDGEMRRLVQVEEMRLQRIDGFKPQLRVALPVEANRWSAEKGPRASSSAWKRMESPSGE